MESTSGSSAMATEGEITMATVKSVERLRAYCDLRAPGVDGNRDDHIFWEGWRESEEQQPEDSVMMDTSSPPRSQVSAQEKPYTPPTKRIKTKKMGF